MAISLAVLPALSQVDAAVDTHRFKSILTQGLRLVLVLIVPAGAGLLALGRPIIELIFQHGAFHRSGYTAIPVGVALLLAGLTFCRHRPAPDLRFLRPESVPSPQYWLVIAATLIYLAVGPALAFVAGWGFLGWS